MHFVEGLEEHAVVLTFDVGAKLATLQKVLDVLRDEGVRTTIFLYTGQLERAPEGPEIVRRMIREGHELANHTRTHRDLTTLEGADEVREELDAVERFVKSIDPEATTRPFVREPYLESNDVVDTIVRSHCYRAIWFTIDTTDWKDGIAAGEILSAVLGEPGEPRRIEPGSIFIFHGSKPATLAALPGVISGLRARGFSFLTVGEALKRAGERAR